MRVWLGVMIVLLGMARLPAGEIQVQRDAETDWPIYTLSHGKTVARLAPDAGCNLYSIKVDGVEFLRVPDDMRRLRGVGYGTPILYPTPNRVRGGKFVFRNREFNFPKNNSGNFIHGLVHSVPWRVTDHGTDDRGAWIEAELNFNPDMPGYQAFPLPHRLRLRILVTDRAVEWTYGVDNTHGQEAVPFGFALHPYFLYQGEREETYLKVPATHWMEAEKLLPTGRLIPLAETEFDLRKPTSLAQLRLDDVFFGMTPEQPVSVDFRDVGRRLTLKSGPSFKHAVIYTPAQPFFCVENQTCSTDAHNLDNAGHQRAAQLQVCEPGKMLSDAVRYEFSLRTP